MCTFTLCSFCYHFYIFFFFKQKTAYEMLRSLVGSEMCIRDRSIPSRSAKISSSDCDIRSRNTRVFTQVSFMPSGICLLYTSDAADDLLCVDLGGRRIIKKKTITLPLG